MRWLKRLRGGYTYKKAVNKKSMNKKTATKKKTLSTGKKSKSMKITSYAKKFSYNPKRSHKKRKK